MRARILLAALFVGLTSTFLHAANATPTQNKFPVAPVVDGVQQVALGHSALALMGPWKFHLGDNMAWAQPGYDDSGWENYTLKAQGLSGLSLRGSITQAAIRDGPGGMGIVESGATAGTGFG